MGSNEWVIRLAEPEEHVALTDLSRRSVQQVWGYPDDSMAWEPDEIAVTREHITDAITSVLACDSLVMGFSVLRADPPEMELSRLMVEPGVVGTGSGRRLWEDAVEMPRAHG